VNPSGHRRDTNPEPKAREEHATCRQKLPVRQAEVIFDLEILVEITGEMIEKLDAERAILLPYQQPATIVFEGLAGLSLGALPEDAARTRLRRYTGRQDDLRPLAEQAVELFAAASATASWRPAGRKGSDRARCGRCNRC
jgi:hypothetical protein